jgi:hypothetical protein
MLTYSQRKAFDTHQGRGLDATITQALADVEEDREVRRQANIAAYAKTVQHIPFTDEQYTAARVVRTDTGWHKVVRVNTKSVTVETGYSWTDRIQRDKIIEVR